MNQKSSLPDLGIAYNDRVEIQTMPDYPVRVIGASDGRCPCPVAVWHSEWIIEDASGDTDYVCSLLVRKVT